MLKKEQSANSLQVKSSMNNSTNKRCYTLIMIKIIMNFSNIPLG